MHKGAKPLSEDNDSRQEAVEVGKQKDISEAAKEIGLLIPVFMTASVWDEWVTPDQKSMEQGEDQKSRLIVVLHKLLYFLRVHRQENRSNLIYFPVSLNKGGESKDIQLLSHLGPLEVGEDKPCITIMSPEEYEDNKVN